MSEPQPMPAPAPAAPPHQPAPAPAATPAPASADPGRESFSREYVHELREENKGWRLKATEMEQRAAAEKAAREAAEKVAQEKVAAAEKIAAEKAAQALQQANDRIIQSELRAAAQKAGMVDLDGLKLLDLSGVKLDENGGVNGVEELMAKAKETKPWMFGAAGPSNTSPSRAPDPAKSPPGRKPGSATAMTDEEWRAARKNIARGRAV